MQVKTLTAIRR